MTEKPANPFSREDFARIDEADDSLFYKDPRLVVHTDAQAIKTIGALFEEVFSPLASGQGQERPGPLPAKPAILDLLSSWRSHWPASGPAKAMVGLGLNAAEMADNPDLDRFVVHNVNANPRLPFEDDTFHGVLLTVSVQYLTRPTEVFKDVNRVLRPGGLFLVVFSNRMFYTKAVRAWTLCDDEDRMRLVAWYFMYAGNYEDIRGICRNPRRGPTDDPVYVVMARKPMVSAESPEPLGW